VAPFDIAMFVGLGRGDASGGTAAFTTGFVGRNLAPAVVHGFHGRGGASFASVGLHAAAIGTGVVIGYAVAVAMDKPCAPTDPCAKNLHDSIPPGPGYGAIAGSMAGTVLDVIFLSHRTPQSWTASAKLEPTWGVTPYAAQHGFGVAAGGTF
jgi:hypothetical protein